jgi:hypothetical protein
MYDLQPQALTDKELIRYADLWLDKESLPIAVQRELIKRIEQLLDARDIKAV